MLIPRNARGLLDIEASMGYASGNVTVTVTTEAGVVLATATATKDNAVAGRYYYYLAPQTALNRLTVVWTGNWGGVVQSIETQAEVVGGYLFTVAEARAFKDGQLADTNLYSDEAILETRDRITDDFQHICGVPFVPRYEREYLDGRGGAFLRLPYKRPLHLASMVVNDVAYGPTELLAVKLFVTGRMEYTRPWPSGHRNVVVEWERGYRSVPPAIKRAALALTHYELVSSEITDRMVTFANELGTVRLSVPGRENPTGIPLVDSVLRRYDECDILVAGR